MTERQDTLTPQTTKSRLRTILICFVIFIAVASASILVAEKLFNLPLPLVFNAPFAVVMAGVGLLFYQALKPSYPSPQPLESQRQTEQVSTHHD
ncbi:MAG: hypothetical protein ACLP9D_03510 [Candidatus Bathyarchaeia archaeon]